MPYPILTPAAMADWLQVLDHVEASIARALEDADRREREWAADAAADADRVGAAERQCLDQIDDRLRGLQANLAAAGELAGAIEALLTADEDKARDCLATAGRARLAALPAAGVS